LREIALKITINKSFNVPKYILDDFIKKQWNMEYLMEWYKNPIDSIIITTTNEIIYFYAGNGELEGILHNKRVLLAEFC
jgi:hypothetical protein